MKHTGNVRKVRKQANNHFGFDTGSGHWPSSATQRAQDLKPLTTKPAPRQPFGCRGVFSFLAMDFGISMSPAIQIEEKVQPPACSRTLCHEFTQVTR